MPTRLRQLERPARFGFTLVELLVVIAIFSIVATLVISGFTINNADRVGNSIATIKNAIEGARSRAIADQSIRGLRLLTDPNNPLLVRSMVYVESAGYDENWGIVEYVPDPGFWRVVNIDDSLPATPAAPVNLVNDTWLQLRQKGLIPNDDPNTLDLEQTMRIELPAHSGNWYTVTRITMDAIDDPIDNMMTRDVARIADFYQPSISTYDSTNMVYTYVPTTGNPIPFRLELLPTVADGAEPIQLDPQTCIDLDGSRVPEAWRLREDTNLNGVLNGTETDLNDPITGTPNGQLDFVNRYSNRMDILFGPDGTVSGDVRTAGLLHLRVCYLDDAILAQPLRQRALAGSFAMTPGYPNFITPVDPQKDHKAVSLFPQTGAIVVSEIDRSQDDGDMNYNSQVGATPFEFATQGAEANN